MKKLVLENTIPSVLRKGHVNGTTVSTNDHIQIEQTHVVVVTFFFGATVARTTPRGRKVYTEYYKLIPPTTDKLPEH